MLISRLRCFIDTTRQDLSEGILRPTRNYKRLNPRCLRLLLQHKSQELWASCSRKKVSTALRTFLNSKDIISR